MDTQPSATLRPVQVIELLLEFKGDIMKVRPGLSACCAARCAALACYSSSGMAYDSLQCWSWLDESLVANLAAHLHPHPTPFHFAWLQFAGDSMIVAFWPTEEEAADDPEGGGLRGATLRAATCAMELADKFGAPSAAAGTFKALFAWSPEHLRAAASSLPALSAWAP